LLIARGWSAVAVTFLVVIAEGDLLLPLPLFLFLPLQFSFLLSSRRDLLLFEQLTTNNQQLVAAST
jgi:hypothetical protein